MAAPVQSFSGTAGRPVDAGRRLGERVHWLSRTLADVPVDNLWLSSGERRRLERLRIDKRRLDWRLGRWTAKQALTSILPSPTHPSAVTIRAAPDGAPEAILDDQLLPVSLSISHACGRSFVCIAPGGNRLGCDLERVEPRDTALARDFFTAAERTLLETLMPNDQTFAVNLVWSAKESVLKALREGLRRDTRSVEIRDVGPSVSSTAWSVFAADAAGAGTFAGWWRRWRGFVLTVAGDGSLAAPRRIDVGSA